MKGAAARLKRLDNWRKSQQKWAHKKYVQGKEKASRLVKGLGKAATNLRVRIGSGFDEDFQKTFQFFLVCVIIALGPAWFGILTFDFTNPAYYALFGGCILVVFLLNRIGLISGSGTIPLIAIFGLNMIGGQIWIYGGNIVSEYFGGSSVAWVGFVLALVILGLYIVHMMFPEFMSTRVVTVIILALLVVASSGYLIGSVERGNLRESIEFQQAQVQANTVDIVAVFENFFQQTVLRGQGNYTGGQVERTFEFKGLEILQIQQQKNTFAQSDDVIIDIDYRSTIPFEIPLRTTAKIDGVGVATADQDEIILEQSADQTVRVNFGKLPRGSYTVDIIPVYAYESTVRVPVKIMTKQFADAISKDQENPQQLLTDYVGGEEDAITSIGPVRIGVSTAGTEIQTPLIYQDDQRLTRLRFQLHEDDQRGEVYSISEAEFNVPQGIQIDNCDFGELDDSTTIGDRLEYGVSTQNLRVGSFETFSCDMYVDSNYQEDLFSEGMWWSPQTIFFTIKYIYKDEQSLAIRVT